MAWNIKRGDSERRAVEGTRKEPVGEEKCVETPFRDTSMST